MSQSPGQSRPMMRGEGLVTRKGREQRDGANVVHNHIDMVNVVILYSWSSSSLLSLIPRFSTTEGLGTRLLLT